MQLADFPQKSSCFVVWAIWRPSTLWKWNLKAQMPLKQVVIIKSCKRIFVLHTRLVRSFERGQVTRLEIYSREKKRDKNCTLLLFISRRIVMVEHQIYCSSSFDTCATAMRIQHPAEWSEHQSNKLHHFQKVLERKNCFLYKCTICGKLEENLTLTKISWNSHIQILKYS